MTVYVFFALIQVIGAVGDWFTTPEACEEARQAVTAEKGKDIIAMSECITMTLERTAPAPKPEGTLIP